MSKTPKKAQHCKILAGKDNGAGWSQQENSRRHYGKRTQDEAE